MALHRRDLVGCKTIFYHNILDYCMRNCVYGNHEIRVQHKKFKSFTRELLYLEIKGKVSLLFDNLTFGVQHFFGSRCSFLY
jgi:hypothetical protein